jgi:hypothetical protein
MMPTTAPLVLAVIVEDSVGAGAGESMARICG